MDKSGKLPKENSIKYWPEADRPREKIFHRGEQSLSDTELLAVMLRSGTKGSSALDLARQIMRQFKTFRSLAAADITQWSRFKGVGRAKIAQLKAALEIGRRFREEEAGKGCRALKSSQDVAELLMPRMRDLPKEVFKAVFLNSRGRVVHIAETARGTVRQVTPLMREIFLPALQQPAAALICVHNHPCGDPAPSPEDKRFTRCLRRAAQLFEIALLDHVVIGSDSYFSFADKGLL